MTTDTTAAQSAASVPEAAALRERVIARIAGTKPSGSSDDWRVLGLSAEESRIAKVHLPVNPRPAAVLVPLVERAEGLTVLLTERATHLKNHAGQISFPGGRTEPDDADAVASALRESREEIGLDSRFVQPIGYLPDHLVISGYIVTPVVALVAPGFELTLDRSEVASTFEVPLDYVFDRANHRPVARSIGDREVRLYEIPFGPHNIWGATAGMLLTLRRLVLEDLW